MRNLRDHFGLNGLDEVGCGPGEECAASVKVAAEGEGWEKVDWGTGAEDGAEGVGLRTMGAAEAGGAKVLSERFDIAAAGAVEAGADVMADAAATGERGDTTFAGVAATTAGGGGRAWGIGAALRVGSCGTKSRSASPPSNHASASCAGTFSFVSPSFRCPKREERTSSSLRREQIRMKVDVLPPRYLDRNGKHGVRGEEDEAVDLGLHEIEIRGRDEGEAGDGGRDRSSACFDELVGNQGRKAGQTFGEDTWSTNFDPSHGHVSLSDSGISGASATTRIHAPSQRGRRCSSPRPRRASAPPYSCPAAES